MKTYIQYGLTIALISIFPSVFATASHSNSIANELVIQGHQIFVSDPGLIESNKNFTFDWNNDATIVASKNQIAAVEAIVKKNSDYSKLNADDRQALASLLYKLGSYYTHVLRKPDLAIEKLELATELLTKKQDRAWNYNTLAYAYELKYAKSGSTVDRQDALNYTREVISDLYDNQPNKEVAFAYCVQGLLYSDSQDYTNAEANFKKALAIYEALPDGKDEQYFRATNRLATIILEQNGREQEALKMLTKVHKYWQAKANYRNNPYAARNLISLGQAYLKIDDAAAARDELQEGVAIYTKLYGKNSPMLVGPYELLADAYQKLGDNKQTEAYLNMAGKAEKG